MRLRMVAMLTILGLPMSAAGQTTPLRTVAQETRALWQSQNARALVNQASQLLLQLPEADPSAPVSRSQAAQLLRDSFRSAEEVDTRVIDVRESEGGLGLVELQRRFRVRGTQEVQEQRVLLSYRVSGNGWMLVELRVSR